MATGDDALAAGMDLVAGTADRRQGYVEINKTRDYIAQRTSAVQPVAKGGTGATTAANARAALGVPETAVAGLKFTTPTFNRISLEAPGVAFPNPIAYVSDVDAARSVADSAYTTANSAQTNASNAYNNAEGRVSKGGDTITGSLMLPNASAANSNFTVAYINGDGRVSRGSSSERYKKFISAVDPEALGDIWPEFKRYQMRSQDDSPSDNTWRYGYIAERLAENADQAPFVIVIDGEVESIDFIGLLLAQVAQLNQRVAKLEGASA